MLVYGPGRNGEERMTDERKVDCLRRAREYAQIAAAQLTEAESVDRDREDRMKQASKSLHYALSWLIKAQQAGR